jgi:hypothetical protein
MPAIARPRVICLRSSRQNTASRKTLRDNTVTAHARFLSFSQLNLVPFHIRLLHYQCECA